MAYTTIDDPTIFFNTVLFTGTASGNKAVTGVGFQPDWVWTKNRVDAYGHNLYDSVRGTGKYISSNSTSAESSSATSMVSFDSDGFTVGTGDNVQYSSNNGVSWNWKAGGSAPAITYSVKVVSDSGNKYRFDDFGTSAVTLDLQEGGTYTFDQSDSSNSGHPLRFDTASDKSGGEYTTGVTTTGTAGSSGAKTVITVAASAPTLYYQCSNHAGMGGQANTNSTFGSSNFSGSIQSTVSAGSTQGFSIVGWTGSGANATIGHGLGVAPKMIIIRRRTASTTNWKVYHESIGNDNELNLNETSAKASSTRFQSTSPTSSVFSVSSNSAVNESSQSIIAYCFAEKKGFSKFGSYQGSGNSDGSYIHLGFKPAFVITKLSSVSGEGWEIYNNKALGYNVDNNKLVANTSGAESTADRIDLLSNGFKARSYSDGINASGGTLIYMAFAESPFVNSKGVPTNAR